MIGIIEYDMGNIQSVANALHFLGASVKVVREAKELASVDKIILPGVGAFGEGREKLNQRGMPESLHQEVIAKKKPFLGICLGMQLICKESFEFGHFPGLSWIDASVRRFEPELKVRVPHIGWNNLLVRRENRLIPQQAGADLDVYFVHSFYVDNITSDYIAATCEYGREFAAVIEQENIFATQFHPEKSQGVGLGILKRFCEL